MTGGNTLAMGPTRENLKPPPFSDTPITDSTEASDAISALLTGSDEDTIPQERPDANDAPAPTESAPDGADTAPPEEATGEEQGDDPQTPAPLDPPRSWSKEQRERWSKLDPDTQTYLLDQDRKTSAELRRGQNEAAELRKANEAEKQALATERQRYVEKLPALIAVATADLMGGEYARMNPEQRMQLSQSDPARLLQLREAHEAKASQVQNLLGAQQELHGKQRAEAEQTFKRWSDEQDTLAREHAPEFFDAKTGAARKAEAGTYLQSLGFTAQDIGELRDHRMLRVIRDALRGRALGDKRAIVEQKVQGKPRVAVPGSAGEQPGIGMSSQKRTAIIRQINSTDNTFEQAKALEQLL